MTINGKSDHVGVPDPTLVPDPRAGVWSRAQYETIDRGDKNAERKCTDCGKTHRNYSAAGQPGCGAMGCIVDPCPDCGVRHVGPLPPLTPCPDCGSGRYYAAHHRCLGTWREADSVRPYPIALPTTGAA